MFSTDKMMKITSEIPYGTLSDVVTSLTVQYYDFNHLLCILISVNLIILKFRSY
jgi:hypothetical protein